MPRALRVNSGQDGARLLTSNMAVPVGTLAGDVFLVGTKAHYVHIDRKAVTFDATVSPQNGTFTYKPVAAADIAALAAQADGTNVNFNSLTRAISFGAPVLPAFKIGEVHKKSTEILAL